MPTHLHRMMRKATQSPRNILAVETAVVDLQYPAGGGDDILKHHFFAHLRELVAANGGTPTITENPRPGDMALVMAEDFDDALITFAHQHHIMPQEQQVMSRKAQALLVRQTLFGQPVATAGGSLANTFHALVRSEIEGQSLVKGHFLTAVGACDTGATFRASLGDSIHANRNGRQMECHVLPMDGDRILIATPSKTDPAEAHITTDLFRHRDGSLQGRDRLMLGGFMFFTPRFNDIYDHVLDHLAAMPEGTRPALVLTASAQTIAASDDFRRKVRRAYGLTNVVVHANSGEFRRLFGMDTDWRRPFDTDFTGLRGKALDKAKDQHVAYKAAKDIANHAALNVAQALSADILRNQKERLLFVVTNGARETFVVDAFGVYTTHPNKVDKAQIVSTVGAGDNFAAGFQLGDLFSLPYALCARMGSDFAAAIIQSHDARLSENDRATAELGNDALQIRGPLANLRGETLRLMAPEQPPVHARMLKIRPAP